MPDPTSSGAVDTITKEIRRVRWRRNSLEVQRALYLLIAVVAAAAALLLLLALAASAALFGVAAVSLAGALAVTAALLALELRRRLLHGGAAASWIDARAALRGKLATLTALTRSGVRAADTFFLPLLVVESLRELPRWRRDRLLPRRVPRVALASALAAIGCLLLTLAIAPRLRPEAPEIVVSDQPLDGSADDPRDGPSSRVVLAPAPPQDAGDSDAPGTSGGGGGDSAADSALARLPAEIQERIRRELWGEAWERMQEALAESERARQGAGAGDDGDDRERGRGEEWEMAALPEEEGAARDGGEAPAARGFTRRDGDEEDDGENAAGAETAGSADSERAAGAGNDTDPDLFGAPSDADGAAGDTFELTITAPARTRRGARRRAANGAPPAAADTRPEVAAGGRDGAAAPRMAVPAAYEPIVRQLYGHRASAEDARP